MSTTPKDIDTLIIKMKKATLKVALCARSPQGVSGEILAGFRDANDAAENHFLTTPYYDMGTDVDHMRLRIVQLLQEKHDLLFCIGPLITALVIEQANMLSVAPPILFCNVPIPHSSGIITDQQNATLAITGVNPLPVDNLEVAETFCMLYPNAQRVIMPYQNLHTTKPFLRQWHNYWHNHHMNPIAGLLNARGIEVNTLAFHDISSVQRSIAEHSTTNDVVMLIEGNLLLNQHQAISDTCTKYAIPLWSGLYSSLKDSASFGYAGSFESLGKKAYEQATKVLFDSIDPRQLSIVTTPINRHAIINTAVAKKQGLNPTQLIARARQLGEEVKILT